MAGGDRRGPRGTGPMTGRGLGYCAGYDRPGYLVGAGPARSGFGRGYDPAGRRGLGFRRGFGRGFGRGYGRGDDWWPAGGFGRGYRWSHAYGEAPVDTTTARVPESWVDEIADLRAQLVSLESRISELLDRDRVDTSEPNDE